MASKANLVIDQGTTFSNDISLKDANGDPLPLTGQTANAQMRKWYTSTAQTDFSTTIDVDAGIVTIGLNSNTTANLEPGRYVYDLKLTDGAGHVQRVVEGIVTVTPFVTR